MTVNEYVEPLVRPVTVQLSPVEVQDLDPDEEVTAYELIAAPPLFDGAVQETVTELSPNTPVTSVGTPGTVAGTTAPDDGDADPEPSRFVATTVNVYDVPLRSPTMVHVVVIEVQVAEPGDEVTVYAVMSAPPFEVGADQDTVTDVDLDTPVTDLGTEGVVAGTIAEEAAEAAPAPFLFVATTVNV